MSRSSVFYLKKALCLTMVLCLVMVAASVGGTWAAEPADSSASPKAPDFAAVGRTFLQQHCLECHAGKEPEAELALDVFGDSMSVIRHREKWERVLRQVTAGEMPPDDRPRPDVKEVRAFVEHVKAIFEHHDRHAPPDPGRVTMRRLNRTEYRNTVRDLLYVDFDPTEAFPSDEVGHGFDNIGDVLTLSPLLMERYLAAAESIARRVILVDPPPPSRRYLAGRYLQPNNGQTPQGRFRPLDPTSDDPTHSGPFTAAGGYLKFSADAELVFRATLYAETSSDAPVKVTLFITGQGIEPSADEQLEQLMGANAGKRQRAKILQTYEITARGPDKLQEIEFPISRIANISDAGIALLKPPPGEEPAKLFIQHLWSEGPLETRPAAQLKLLDCPPELSEAERSRHVLSRLLRRAYRRTPTDAELARLLGLVERSQADGLKWEAAIQRAIIAILCSPKFLFRVELDDRRRSPRAEPLDEFQLASRLSYFLWSTMPDDELLDLAEKKQLTANLETQVRRMIADPKSIALVRNFGLQWLQVQRLEQIRPDAARFPSFDNRLRAAMLQETELFFESVMREDRGILDLLGADYTFLNEPLAVHYGIADTEGNPRGGKTVRPGGKPINGEAFQRVTLQGGRRGGLLTQASVLTVTSNPTRTSPVKRGRWVLEQILGEPPPPPPPNVPELPEDERSVATGSLRQRLEAHRKDPRCANCHARMDPIGFALENYDAVGAFRTKDGQFEIDPSGEFSDGTPFQGPEEFKAILGRQRRPFTRCLAEKMLTYALGRGLEYYDRAAVEQIVAGVEAADYRFSALVLEIVGSDPFRKRRGLATERATVETDASQVPKSEDQPSEFQRSDVQKKE